MRYFFNIPNNYSSMYGRRYICDHIAYTACTLYIINKKGLAVIQQQYDPCTKLTWWDEIDERLIDIIYTHENFKYFFDKYSDYENDGIYPTVTLRQLMHGIGMKPLKKKPWETVFDRIPL